MIFTRLWSIFMALCWAMRCSATDGSHGEKQFLKLKEFAFMKTAACRGHHVFQPVFLLLYGYQVFTQGTSFATLFWENTLSLSAFRYKLKWWTSLDKDNVKIQNFTSIHLTDSWNFLQQHFKPPIFTICHWQTFSSLNKIVSVTLDKHILKLFFNHLYNCF